MHEDDPGNFFPHCEVQSDHGGSVAPILVLNALHQGVLRIKKHEIDILIKGKIRPQLLATETRSLAVHTVGERTFLVLDLVAPAGIGMIQPIGSDLQIAE